MTTTTPRAPLTPEQQALATKARPLVEQIANKLRDHYARFATLSELIALGNIGLVEAAHAFDPDLGVQFTTFAGYRIEGAILDALRKELTFHHGLFVSARVGACEFLSTQVDKSDPLNDTDEDCSRRLKAFSDGLLASMFATMLQRARQANNEEEIADRSEYTVAMKALDAAIEGLAERDRKLIHLHYREGRDLKEVGKELGVSYATVRRYHNAVMERLAAQLRQQGIKNAPALENAP